MIELKIIKKYFNAILNNLKPSMNKRFKKWFELRHEWNGITNISAGTKFKLNEIGSNRYIIFECGAILPLIPYHSQLTDSNEIVFYVDSEMKYVFDDSGIREAKVLFGGEIEKGNYIAEWYDKFCWNYINKKQTYLIEIAEILEVK